MEKQRPKPEDLLKKIHHEELENQKRKREKNGNRGKFKIFLGYCAGVGKTYRMLEEAISIKQQGVDVIIAVAESHGREEINHLLQNLEIIQKRKNEYRNIIIEEMDLDAVLERKPHLVVVDELAHTNSPGSRHEKRYQDVDELLNAGIDVYTTLNIQHVESVVDLVYQITLIKVQETVPDRILLLADEIELVDLSPEKLLERLREGKVYIPQKAETAMLKFFTIGNLLALRELSLRYTAKRVDEDILSYKERYSIQDTGKMRTKILVAISSSPNSENLLRMAHRMATNLDVEWYAIHVTSPQQIKLDDLAQSQLNNNIRLAEELGATVFALSGTNVAKVILDFADKQDVSLIVTGASKRSRLDVIFKGSILNDLIKENAKYSILIVSEKMMEFGEEKKETTIKTNTKPYVLSLLIFIATGIVAFLLDHWIQSPGISGMLLLLPPIISGLLWGSRVSLLILLLAIVCLDLFFIPPLFTFKIQNIKYLMLYIVFITVFFIINSLTRLIKWQAESSRKRERFLSSLCSFNREIFLAKSRQDMLYRSAKYISEAFENEVVILIPNGQENLEIEIKTNKNLILNKNEIAAATWTFKNGLPSGRSTKTLSSLSWYFLPINIQDKTVGVIALAPKNPTEELSYEQNKLLISFTNVIALMIYQKYKNSGSKKE